MAAARLDKVWPEFDGKVVIKYRAFPLEVINERSAPRHIVDQEWPLIAVQEPLSPCKGWPHEEYVRTTMPLYEAYASAYGQDPEKARVYDLKLRKGFYWEGRRIDEREVILEIAAESGLDPVPIGADLDSGKYKENTMDDYREALRLRDEEGVSMTSPTLFLPSGEIFHNPFASEKKFEDGKLTEVLPPSRYGEDVYEGYREIVRKAVS